MLAGGVDAERWLGRGLVARPRAKVNLALAVTGRRADGYHELASVFLRVGLADRLSARLADPALPEDRMTVTGADGLPVEGNLVMRAIELLRAEIDLPLPPLELALEKRIPVAAGLAGGSADAAAALGLAAEIWGVGLSPEREGALALALGADVPFFVGGHDAALVEGIGERLTALPGLRDEAGLLIVTPPVPLSTPEVFRAYDGLDRSESGAARVVADLTRALREGSFVSDLVSWSDRLASANDLWSAALAVRPELADMRGRLEDRLGRHVLMTGSGATFVGLYASAQEAARAGQALLADVPQTLAASSVAACDPAGLDPIWRSP